jgi:hypothetical protein
MTAAQTVQNSTNVLFCTRCVPSRDGPLDMEAHLYGVNAKIAFITPEPTGEELVKRKLYVSNDNGGMLFRAMVDKQFDKSEYVIIPVKGCQGSTANCRDHLERYLHGLGRLKGVVLVGGEGKNAWRPDITLSQSQGFAYKFLDKWWCVPIINPDSVIKGYEKKADLRYQLDNVRCLVDNAFQPDFIANYDCPKRGCKLEGVEQDPDGVWYCAKHWKPSATQWKKVRKEWVENKEAAVRLKLFEPQDG